MPRQPPPNTTGQRAVNAPRSSPNTSGARTVNQISVDLYNAMYAAWCERQTVAHVMKACRVNRQTAERYVERGDPKRKLPPLRARWERTQQAAQMAEDYSLVKARREIQTVGRAFLQRVAQRIANLDPADLDPNAVIKQLQTVQVVLERTLGVSDATVTVRGGDRFDNWATEDLLEFARSGQLPDYARGGSPGGGRPAKDD
jgi:hypothetical protein